MVNMLSVSLLCIGVLLSFLSEHPDQLNLSISFTIISSFHPFRIIIINIKIQLPDTVFFLNSDKSLQRVELYSPLAFLTLSTVPAEGVLVIETVTVVESKGPVSCVAASLLTLY
jgi:hypothetical protein